MRQWRAAALRDIGLANGRPGDDEREQQRKERRMARAELAKRAAERRARNVAATTHNTAAATAIDSAGDGGRRGDDHDDDDDNDDPNASGDGARGSPVCGTARKYLRNSECHYADGVSGAVGDVPLHPEFGDDPVGEFVVPSLEKPCDCARWHIILDDC